MKKPHNLKAYIIFLIVFAALAFQGCKKDKTPKYETGTVKDKQGNTYVTVKIGDQWWMAENLKSIRLNDSTAIPSVNITNTSISKSQWMALVTPGYCWYEDKILNAMEYGALYNWYAVNTGKLCPTGWHVPTSTEWQSLIDLAGGSSQAFINLRIGGYWNYSYIPDATDKYGFKAIPGGYRSEAFAAAGFDRRLKEGRWWSSDYNADKGDVILLTGETESAYIYWNYKKDGCSVRCVKDNPAN
jgi:uncharacterized protein (TIGR02145 family)